MRFLPTVLVLSGYCAAIAAGAQQAASPLRAYTTCHFDYGPDVVQSAPLPAGTKGRTVLTSAGPRQIPVVRGQGLLFAFSGDQAFARVVVEQLPPASFAENKHDLIAGFDESLGADKGAQRNYGLKPQLNGLDIFGYDHSAQDAEIVGHYMLIDNAGHAVANIDFLNPPDKKPFHSMSDYYNLRDQFLAHYTGCIHAAPAAKPVQAKRAPVKKKK